MNYSLLYILLFFFCITSKLNSQDIDSHYRSIEECMQQYEGLLQQLHEVQQSSQSNDLRITNLHHLLCQNPGPLFPFGKLYTEVPVECNSSKLNPIYKISPDCTNRQFLQPLVEYFIQYIHKTTVIPRIYKLEIIFDEKDKVFVRYQSDGETIETCNSSNRSRIAILHVDNDDVFINQLRWATTQENNAISLHTIQLSSDIVQVKIPVNSAIPVLTKQVKDLELKLSEAINKLSESEKSYNKEKFRSDSLENILLAIERKQGEYYNINLKQKDAINSISNQLTESKRMAEANRKKYLYIKDSIRMSIIVKLKDIDEQVSDLGSYYFHKLQKYDQYNYNRTLFTGISYGLIQAPFNIDANVLRSKDPIRKSFHRDDFLRNFDLSLYHLIGLSLSNLRINSKKLFDNTYSSIQADEYREALFLSGKNFKDIYYIRSDHDITSFNIGITIYAHSILDIFFLSKNKIKDIPIINSLFIKFGIAYLKGSVWDYYDGNYLNYMTRDPSSGYYILDLHNVKTTDYYFGLSYVKPYFQLDLGYNRLYGDFYLNLGVNYPFKDVRSPFSYKISGPNEDKGAEELRTKIKNIQKLINNLKLN